MPELGYFAPDEYLKPNSIEEVVNLLQRYGDKARIVAGGTALYELAKRGMIPQVKKMIDLEYLNLRYVRSDEEGIKIGCMVKIYELANSPILDIHPYYSIKEAALNIRPVQIRNMATVGGEICSAIPFLDLPTVFLALDAKLRIIGPKGERKIDMDGFYFDYFLTSLGNGEFVIEVMIPKLPDKTGSAFLKFERTAVDLPLVNVGVSLMNKNGECKNVRIALGGGRTHVRIKSLERALEGKRFNDKILDDIVQSLSDEFKPISSAHASTEYKLEIAKILLRDALLIAYKRSQGD
ncbi:MAG: xanthine dehydrogenase family protein subunit M [Nitrososphaerales archaeon]